MRAVPRVRDVLGFVALALALLLASPGVRVSGADDFSYDPALEPRAAATATPATEQGPSCAANGGLPAAPLRPMPLLVADGEGLNSLNGRGFNIGKSEPDGDLQRLMFEVRRHSH